MKVYITGMGCITSLGNSVADMFNALIENRSGVKVIPQWKTEVGLFTHVGAPVIPYDIMKVPRSARRTMSAMAEMSVLATQEALAQAGLNVSRVKSPRGLLCMGSTTGSPEGMATYFKKYFDRGGPEGQMGTSFFKVMSHTVSANVAAAIEFHGPALSPSSACSTSAQAMILGWELIQSGLYDFVIAGGADEFHQTSAAVFDIVLAASRGYNGTPEQTPRPFDIRRDGLAISAGASVVVLESEESCKRRGAKPLGQFVSGAYLCDGSHMSQSSQSNMVDVMNEALERGKISKGAIDYVNAHATGTVQGDQAEAKAIGQLFGDQTPVSSLKGHFGHSLAACGALEVIASVKMLEKSVIIPTRNLKEIDPECSSVLHIQEIKACPMRALMSNNFAFGGMNTSIVVSDVGGIK